jgi:hypothetical protein
MGADAVADVMDFVASVHLNPELNHSIAPIR